MLLHKTYFYKATRSYKFKAVLPTILCNLQTDSCPCCSISRILAKMVTERSGRINLQIPVAAFIKSRVRVNRHHPTWGCFKCLGSCVTQTNTILIPSLAFPIKSSPHQHRYAFEPTLLARQSHEAAYWLNSTMCLTYIPKRLNHWIWIAEIFTTCVIAMRAVCLARTSRLVKMMSKSISLTTLPPDNASVTPFSVSGMSTSLHVNCSHQELHIWIEPPRPHWSFGRRYECEDLGLNLGFFGIERVTVWFSHGSNLQTELSMPFPF